MRHWDVLVIGGGHAGCEAAIAAARLGCRTALLTLDPERIAVMSCNPAIGGIGKGQLVREIDALGGVMGRIADQTAIQYRRLNASKGPAVRASRAQCDKDLYSRKVRDLLATVAGLDVLAGEVSAIVTSGGRAVAAILVDGRRLDARAVVISAGTFLRGLMHTGADRSIGGRAGDRSAEALSSGLRELGFRLRRLKTGTPPRLHRASIDFSKTERQRGDASPVPFSYYYKGARFPELSQVECFITYTNTQTHDIIEKNFFRSPLFTGVIEGIGPRYCPSIEDKLKRFRERDRHQIFLEPEGLATDEIYVNGASTSLPKDVQDEFIRTIPGLQSAEFARYGYAVEYDAIDPTGLLGTLESKDVPSLYFAGQVNGTSGYEEAAAQGLVAGLNAGRQVLGLEPVTIGRDEGYIGVMIDDLIVRGADEPYRMFTSRAEYRLLLREDNADLRLSEKGYRAGLLDRDAFDRFQLKREAILDWTGRVQGTRLSPSLENTAWFEARGLAPFRDSCSAAVLLRRPEVGWSELCALGFDGQAAPGDVAEQVEIQIKYEGYIRRELAALEGMRKSEHVRIPLDIDFESVPGLSAEVRGRLKAVRPQTIGQAGRMPGITPAAVATLAIFLKMRESRHE